MWVRLVLNQARKSEGKFPKEAVAALRGLEEELAESQKDEAENKKVLEGSPPVGDETPQPTGPPSAAESGSVDLSSVSKHMEKVARDAIAEILPILSRILENVRKSAKPLSGGSCLSSIILLLKP